MKELSVLEKLASYFDKKANSPLYIVGGYVRDKLIRKLELEETDVDLTAALTPDEVKDILEGSEFIVKPASKKLGTLIIKYRGIPHFEYTTFRKDSYREDSGEHTPLKVEFIKDIKVDALRRDFKCNAVYYDILKKEIIDPLNGVKDIKKELLSTTRSPKEVFKEDGLRLLRLVRFESTLGFKIEKETFKVAKEESFRILDIAKERIIVELDKLLKGDNVLEALHSLRDLGLLGYICPDLMKGDKMIQNQKYHSYDVLEHSFRCCVNCPKDLRLAGLLHDIGKPYCYLNYGKYYKHEIYGIDLVTKWMKEYKYSKAEINKVIDMMKFHMFDFNGQAKETTVRKFIIAHIDILDDLLKIMHADALATGKTNYSMPAKAIKEQLRKLKEHNISIHLKDLAVTGEDLKELGYQGKEIKVALERLQELEYTTLVKRDKDQLLIYASHWLEGIRKECKK